MVQNSRDVIWFVTFTQPVSVGLRRCLRLLRHICVQVPHGPLKQRDEANAKVQELLKDNAGKDYAERKMLYRMEYAPGEGMFKNMPADLKLGRFIPKPKPEDGKLDASQRFVQDGQQYGVGCFVYITPEYAPHCFFTSRLSQAVPSTFL